MKIGWPSTSIVYSVREMLPPVGEDGGNHDPSIERFSNEDVHGGLGRTSSRLVQEEV